MQQALKEFAISLPSPSGLELIELKSLKGQFLAASPAMGDPRFVESLVLMAFHDETGALGFIINQPMSNLSFYELLDQLEIDNPEGVTDHLIFNGGPVRANNGFVIYEGALGLRDEARIGERLFYSRSLEALKRIAEGRGPERYLVCLGRAEWAPGQLEQELTQNVWLPLVATADLVFGEDIEGLWTQVLGQHGINPANFTQAAGHA